LNSEKQYFPNDHFLPLSTIFFSNLKLLHQK
jgi:hypothetical protein